MYPPAPWCGKQSPWNTPSPSNEVFWMVKHGTHVWDVVIPPWKKGDSLQWVYYCPGGPFPFSILSVFIGTLNMWRIGFPSSPRCWSQLIMSLMLMWVRKIWSTAKTPKWPWGRFSSFFCTGWCLNTPVDFGAPLFQSNRQTYGYENLKDTSLRTLASSSTSYQSMFGPQSSNGKRLSYSSQQKTREMYDGCIMWVMVLWRALFVDALTSSANCMYSLQVFWFWFEAIHNLPSGELT